MTEEAGKKCPQCGKDILGGFENCAYCGWAPDAAPATDEEDRLEKYWYPTIWGMAFFLIPVGIGVGMSMTALWRNRHPRKAAQMARLTLVSHLAMLAVVVLSVIILNLFFKPYLDSLVQNYLSQ